MITPTLAFLNGEAASIILIAVVAFAVLGRASQPAPLVLKSWYASDKPLPDGSFIQITGRRAGIVGFIFALLGIDPVTTLKVSNQRIEFHSSSLTGTSHRITPPGFGFLELFRLLQTAVLSLGDRAYSRGDHRPRP